jgi:hypothetical protein
MQHAMVIAIGTHMVLSIQLASLHPCSVLVFPSSYVYNLCLSVEEAHKYARAIQENLECDTQWQCTIMPMLHIRLFAM